MDIELLNPDRLVDWCSLIAVPPAAIPALREMAAEVSADAALLQVFRAFHEQTALRGEWLREWAPLPFDPLVESRLGERASLFYLLAYLSALPHAWQNYQRLGVSLEIFKDTMLDFRFYIQDYYDLRGRWGYAQFPWIWRHLSSVLFRLGRLQYMLIPFQGGVTAYRRRAGASHDASASGALPEILLLADPEMSLRQDGYAYGAGNPQSESDAPAAPSWQPLFEARSDGWRGHPVSPNGRAAAQPVFLPSAEWELILQRGDTVLDLHIPRADPLNAQTCGGSYAQALEFFPRVFPGTIPRALYCHTWMFSPQLQQLLPPESNLVKFQREFYLYPSPGGVGFLWSFVFGEKYPDPASAPRDTFLRRAVLDWLAAGGEIFDLPGLMFHAPHDWGKQPYYRS